MTREEAHANCPPDSYVEYYSGPVVGSPTSTGHTAGILHLHAGPEARGGGVSERKKRSYVVVETYESVGQFEVKATSKREALAKVSDHLTTMGGHPDVQPIGGVEGHMTGSTAYTEAGYQKMQGEKP